jgi:dipeptidyl aminopeptidase/acylaminoacyl peptidase
MKTLRHLLHALPLAFLLCIAPHAHAQAAPAAASLEQFFGESQAGDARLSPNGRYLATRTVGPNQRMVLVVLDLANNAMTRVAAYATSDVRRFMWVSDQRLLYDLEDRNQAPGAKRNGPGLYAVNRDGAGEIQLVARTGRPEPVGHRKLLSWSTWLPEQPGIADSNTVFVVQPVLSVGRLKEMKLIRLDTVTGQTQQVERPGEVFDWIFDSKGEPRLARTHDGASTVLHYRDPATGAWHKLASYRSYAKGPDTIWPIGFGPDGTLYVASRSERDTTALYTMDTRSGKLGDKPLVVTEGYDFFGKLVNNGARVLGVTYETDARANAWFDPAMQALQQRIDKALPDTVNLLTVASQADAPWVMVESYSDVHPATYSLFHRTTGELRPIGSARPGIDPQHMAQQQTVHYKARDGRELQALLTVPRGADPKHLPLVVLAHDGPWNHAPLWGWQAESQFLASLGYAVLEPAYRGTTGLGFKLFSAGWKQWGGAMQDDLADGVKWAAAQGLADPARACIAGGGYGGYAALMGLARDASLYKCGVAWGAPTDLSRLYRTGWGANDAVDDDFKMHGLPMLLGDPAESADKSPLAKAANITQPLLLAYGGVDYNVPIDDGRKLAEALKGSNKYVTLLEYPDDYNGFKLESTRLSFWRQVATFLRDQIGNKP